MPARPARLATVIVLALVGSWLGACGRRGGLEPPNSVVEVERPSQGTRASPRALPQGVGLGSGTPAPDPNAVREGDEIATAATPAANDGVPVQTSRGAKRGYVVPRQPFFLDPIL